MKIEPRALATGIDCATVFPIAPEAIAFGSGKKGIFITIEWGYLKSVAIKCRVTLALEPTPMERTKVPVARLRKTG